MGTWIRPGFVGHFKERPLPALADSAAMRRFNLDFFAQFHRALYVVTTLEPGDDSTRTEVCADCHGDIS